MCVCVCACVYVHVCVCMFTPSCIFPGGRLLQPPGVSRVPLRHRGAPHLRPLALGLAAAPPFALAAPCLPQSLRPRAAPHLCPLALGFTPATPCLAHPLCSHLLLAPRLRHRGAVSRFGARRPAPALASSLAQLVTGEHARLIGTGCERFFARSVAVGLRDPHPNPSP